MYQLELGGSHMNWSNQMWYGMLANCAHRNVLLASGKLAEQ